MEVSGFFMLLLSDIVALLDHFLFLMLNDTRSLIYFHFSGGLCTCMCNINTNIIISLKHCGRLHTVLKNL